MSTCGCTCVIALTKQYELVSEPNYSGWVNNSLIWKLYIETGSYTFLSDFTYTHSCLSLHMHHFELLINSYSQVMYSNPPLTSPSLIHSHTTHKHRHHMRNHICMCTHAYRHTCDTHTYIHAGWSSTVTMSAEVCLSNRFSFLCGCEQAWSIIRVPCSHHYSTR